MHAYDVVVRRGLARGCVGGCPFPDLGVWVVREGETMWKMGWRGRGGRRGGRVVVGAWFAVEVVAAIEVVGLGMVAVAVGMGSVAGLVVGCIEG